MFLIRFLFRIFFKLLFLSLLVGAGLGAYLFIQYKPLIDYMANPVVFSSEAESGEEELTMEFKRVEEKPLAPNTVDARNISIRKEKVPSELSSLASMPEASPYRARAEQELKKVKSVPVSGLLALARSKISEARSKLSEASAKLAKAHPQDPQKVAKVAKARSLVPKAQSLLNRADALVNSLAGMQDKVQSWFK